MELLVDLSVAVYGSSLWQTVLAVSFRRIERLKAFSIDVDTEIGGFLFISAKKRRILIDFVGRNIHLSLNFLLRCYFLFWRNFFLNCRFHLTNWNRNGRLEVRTSGSGEQALKLLEDFSVAIGRLDRRKTLESVDERRLERLQTPFVSHNGEVLPGGLFVEGLAGVLDGTDDPPVAEEDGRQGLVGVLGAEVPRVRRRRKAEQATGGQLVGLEAVLPTADAEVGGGQSPGQSG